MGSRATIRIIHPTSDTPIHLYTHWTGHDTPNIVVEALKRCNKAGRLSDYQYATRIIFDTLTGLTGDELGYGICIGDEGQPGDVQFQTITIEWRQQADGSVGQPLVKLPHTKMAYTAIQYIDRMNDPDLAATIYSEHPVGYPAML